MAMVGKVSAGAIDCTFHPRTCKVRFRVCYALPFTPCGLEAYLLSIGFVRMGPDPRSRAWGP